MNLAENIPNPTGPKATKRMRYATRKGSLRSFLVFLNKNKHVSGATNMFQAPELQQKNHIFPTRRPPQKKQSRSPIKNKISSPEIEFPVHFFHQNPRVLWDIFLRYLFFRLLFVHLGNCRISHEFTTQEEFHRQMLQKLALHLAAQPDSPSNDGREAVLRSER